MKKNQEQRRTNSDLETRHILHEETRAKVVNAESRTIRGYGIVFNKESVDLRAGGRVFREVIRPEAMDGIDTSRMLAMHNHDSNRLLGNAASGTMRTGTDATGVWYEVDLPDSPTGQDVFISVQRGDTQGSSFQFTIAPDGERWSMRGGKAFREVTKFGGVYEMGPVSEPAYPDTSIGARSLEAMEAAEKEDRANEDKDWSVSNSAYFIQQVNWTMEETSWRLRNLEKFMQADPDNSQLYQETRDAITEAREALKRMIGLEAQIISTVNGQRSEEKSAETRNDKPAAMTDEEFEQLQLLV
jgi:HK97 family phage prohead protease